jgi:hypothetical protein
MRFPSRERFHRYCIAKRRTYLRQLERRSPRAFYDLWKGELELATGRFDVGPASRDEAAVLALELRWLLLHDLHQLARTVVPDFEPAPPSVVRTLPGALHQVRVARSMLIAGAAGVGKEQLAILLHVLAGRPGALVRLAAEEIGRDGGPPTRQMMPERGSVFLRDLESIGPRGQDELLAFLNREARHRDLLIIVGTCQEPRSLVPQHGIRRDLFVRVSQTEVRLPTPRPGSEDMGYYLGDVVYDLIRVAPERLPDLRKQAETLAATWHEELGRAGASAQDLFPEALSYAMWLERKDLSLAVLRQPWCAQLAAQTLTDNYAGLYRQAKRRLGTMASSETRETDVDEAPQLVRRPVAEDVEASVPRLPERDPAVPTHLSRDQLLREYYLALMREERGDLRRVAARAGRKIRVVQTELARLQVRFESESASVATEP